DHREHDDPKAAEVAARPDRLAHRVDILVYEDASPAAIGSLRAPRFQSIVDAMRPLLLLAVLAVGCSSTESPADLAVRDLAVGDLSPDPANLLGLWQEPGSGYIWRFSDD